MTTEAFKFDKLIATVKKLGSSNLYHVKVTGMGDEFETSVPAEDHAAAAHHVVEELTFAAHHPHKFFNRRKLAAQESGETAREVQKMIDVANEAVSYAARNKESLINAVHAIDEDRARKLGG